MTIRLVGFLSLLFGCSILWPDASFATPTSSESAMADEARAPKPTAAVQKLLDEARCLAEDDQPLVSLRIANEALEIARRADDRVGEALAKEELGNAFEHLDCLDEAITVRQEAFQLWEGTGDPLRQLRSLNALAKVTLRHGLMNTDEGFVRLAKDGYAVAAEMGQREVPGTPVVVESMDQLGYCEYMLESTDSAKDHYLEALRLQRALVPTGSMEEATILRHLGSLESNLAELAAAQGDLAEAVALGERLDPKSADFEKSLESLALVENAEGDSFAARARLERALTVNQEIGGSLGPTYMNLGVVALDQYDFGGARMYFERALKIFQDRSPNTPGVPFALGNLAMTFYREGDLSSAIDYEKRCMIVNEARMGQGLVTADDYVVMGEILRDQRRFDESAEYFQRALDIRQKITPDSLHVADALMDLARLERARGNREAAIAYDRRALQIGEKACPETQCAASRGEILSDLGQLAYEQGDFAGAESFLRQAVSLREKSLGPKHPDLARSLNILALTEATLGNQPEAREMALRAEAIGADHLRITARTLSERQALAYEGVRASGLDVALSVGTDGSAGSLAGRDLFDAVIRSRALVFDELAARHRAAYTSEDPEVAQLADQLLSARRRLATLVARGVGDSTPEEYRRNVEDAREKKERVERMLAERSVAFREDQARVRVGIKEIEASLPSGSALVAFVRYARYDFREAARLKKVPRTTPSYAAFILRIGQRDPEFVRMGSAREIESSLAGWRRAIARETELMDGSAASEDSYRRVGGALRHRLWDPLVSGIGKAREVFVVPDAALHLVNLVALPVGGARYLVETGPLIHYLSTERDLVPSGSRSGEGILVVGNPAFDRASKVTVALNQPRTLRGATTGVAESVRRGTRSACGSFKTMRFPPLPASEKEADDIAALWKGSASEGARSGDGVATVRSGPEESLELTGVNASRETFEESAQGKRVLHVATHGFFLEGGCESAVQRADPNQQVEGLLPATAENPLLLSGLAFAGANRRAEAGPDESDGILTAEEIAGINLEGVGWAVLSACDTGVGEIKVGEGVFGLRRAFQVAGAKTVIMSLWPVEDETTRQWMGILYREHFRSGKDTPESVRSATMAVLRQRRTKHQSTHPFYWGAFIAAGDWH